MRPPQVVRRVVGIAGRDRGVDLASIVDVDDLDRTEMVDDESELPREEAVAAAGDVPANADTVADSTGQCDTVVAVERIEDFVVSRVVSS